MMTRTMRRRRLILLLISAILILCTLWLRSYYVGDDIDAWYDTSGQRRLSAGWHSERGVINAGLSWRGTSSYRTRGFQHHSFLPGRFRRPTERWIAFTAEGLSLNPPYWLAVGVLGTLLAARILYVCLRRRREAGLCATCGYDLRASRQRCPECGTAIPPKAAEAPQ